MTQRGWRLGTALLLLTALPALVLTAPPPPARAVQPVRVLLWGDSLTHGVAGDWTWRYRLWRALDTGSGTPVDFVGIRTDVWDTVAGAPGSHEYVDPAFDQDHAARGAMTIAAPEIAIDQLVEDLDPDVVVVMLGTNDIGGGREPALVVDDLVRSVEDARSVDPEIDVIVSTVMSTWLDGAPELNGLLAERVPALDTAQSRVQLAEPQLGFAVEHTYDGVHPNAAGEVLIAEAVHDRLAVLGVAEPPVRARPFPVLGPRFASALSGTVVDGRVSLSWTRSPGADTTRVSARDVTAGSGWTVVVDERVGTTWVGEAPAGRVVEYAVLPRKGWDLAAPDITSNVVRFVVPGTPRHLRVNPAPSGDRSATVRWRAAPAASSYVVELKRRGHRWRVVAGDRKRVRLMLHGLRPGPYAVRVRASTSSGTGHVTDPTRFRVG